MHHPVVGELDLPYESFPLAADPTLSLVAYTAEPASPSEDALRLLASWQQPMTSPSNRRRLS